MNLPSIFKSAPIMKATNNANKNDKFEMNVPQDMFGLGIQVFKIQSKKQIAANTRSLGKVRQQIKVIQNPKKTSNIPAIPKPKKVSAILPSITKTPSQKQYKLEGITKTDSILSKKSIEKHNKYLQKTDAIQQYPHNQPSAFNRNVTQNPNQKHKTYTTSRSANKSVQINTQHHDDTTQGTQKCINKQEWRKSLNTLRKFYTQMSQYAGNQQSKLGRRKNQQYLGEQPSFISAYINKNQPYFYESEELYDPFSIQNFKITSNSCQLEDKNYQDYQAS